MVNVSQAWATASRETLLPEMTVELTYRVTDPGIHEDAVVTGLNHNANSKVSELLIDDDLTERKYGNLGWNMWCLDGSANYYDPAYIKDSYMARYYGVFDDTGWAEGVNPQIILTFDEVRSSVLPGMTITWSPTFNEWATAFSVTAYRGDQAVATTTVTGNTSVVSDVRLDLTNYNKIVITVLRWSLPHGMARCVSVYLGGTTVLTKSDLMGYTHTQSADLLSAALPKNEITFQLRNEKGQWNPDNPSGYGQYLLDQQEVHVRYGMKLPTGTEWIEGGVFWLSEWEVPSNGMEATFTARDNLTFMNDVYAGAKTGTLYGIAETALKQANLPKLSTGAPAYYLDPVLKDYETSFESDFTIAEVLQLIAHAGACVIYQDRYGTLRIAPWEPQYGGYVIDQAISYAHPEYEISKPLRAVSVGYGEDLTLTVPHSNKGEVQTVDSELIRSKADAERVASKTIEVLKNRKVISGEYRADLRTDCFDSVIVTSRYASNIIALTDVEYSTTGGAFRGRYTGRVVSVSLKSSAYFAGDLYAGEV